MNFMPFTDNPNKLPHLLDQEVLSLRKILEHVLKLYVNNNSSSNSKELQKFSEPWLQKIVIIILEGYIEIDALNPANYSKGSFVVSRNEAYLPIVEIVLKGVATFTSDQFRKNVQWLSSLLSKLIICSDKNVRVLVSEVFNIHIMPLLK